MVPAQSDLPYGRMEGRKIGTKPVRKPAHTLCSVDDAAAHVGDVADLHTADHPDPALLPIDRVQIKPASVWKLALSKR